MIGGIKYLLFLLIISLFTIPSSFSLIINEIMYDPLGSDIDSEWIEIYNNNEPLDITKLRLNEDNTNHLISSYQGQSILETNEHAIIADDPEKFLLTYPDFNNKLFDSAFSLSNSQETLELIDINNNISYDITSYTSSQGASNNGFSLSRNNNQFEESIPTPGSPNQFSNICDWKIDIESEFIFENGDDFFYKLKIRKVIGNEANLTIIREITDEFNNKIKSYNPLKKSYLKSSSIETLTYTPNLDEGKPYLVKSSIQDISCNDINTSNNEKEFLVFVKGLPKPIKSSIEIENILDLGSDNDAEFGQTIRARIKVYKGDTTKNSIKLYVKKDNERISKESKTSILDKFSSTTLTIPIQLFDNCGNKYDEGKYTLHVEGLDEDDKKEFDIEGIKKGTCSTSTQTSRPKSSTVTIQELPSQVYNGDILEIKSLVYNGKPEKHDYKIYSYIYRGSKSYPENKKLNIKSFSLKSKEEATIILNNPVYIPQPGNYKIKVILEQDNLKTNKQDTKDITIQALNNNKMELMPTFNENTLSIDLLSNGQKVLTEQFDLNNIPEDQETSYTNNLIYESNNERIKKIIPVLLILVSILLNIIFIIKS